MYVLCDTDTLKASDRLIIRIDFDIKLTESDVYEIKMVNGFLIDK